MGTGKNSKIVEIISSSKEELLENWLKEQKEAKNQHTELISEDELRHRSEELLSLFVRGCLSGIEDTGTEAWSEMRDFLSSISRNNATQGFSPSETATYIFSLKQPIFAFLRQELSNEPDKLFDEIWTVSRLLDSLGLHSFEEYQRGREEIIERQRQEMIEHSNPVMKIWEGILTVPLIGTLDSDRAQVIMENLLQKIVDTESSLVIIEISGVPTVDTEVAQYLFKTVSAAKLMGTECIISGIRPQIAQTMVQLGVAFDEIVTKTTLADALQYAFKQSNIDIVHRQKRA